MAAVDYYSDSSECDDVDDITDALYQIKLHGKRQTNSELQMVRRQLDELEEIALDQQEELDEKNNEIYELQKKVMDLQKKAQPKKKVVNQYNMQVNIKEGPSQPKVKNCIESQTILQQVNDSNAVIKQSVAQAGRKQL